MSKGVSIREKLDVFHARQHVRGLAGQLGFGHIAREELAIVASELATNILKYAGVGELEFRTVEDPVRGAGIVIEARDAGPGIENFSFAVRDGYGGSGPLDPAKLLTRGGIGAGLGAVVRMTDALEYEYEAGNKCVRATRYVRPERRDVT